VEAEIDREVECVEVGRVGRGRPGGSPVDAADAAVEAAVEAEAAAEDASERRNDACGRSESSCMCCMCCTCCRCWCRCSRSTCRACAIPMHKKRLNIARVNISDICLVCGIWNLISGMCYLLSAI
jgi:hypothetical protein